MISRDTDEWPEGRMDKLRRVAETVFMPRKSARARLTVTLSSVEGAWVRARAASTGCRSPSEYVQRLIRADQGIRSKSELEDALRAGLRSPTRRIGPKEWEKLRADLRRKFAGNRRAR